MKTILITNDDGFDALGLKALVDALKDIANVLVVAPSGAKSASGHSLTLTKPLKFIEVEKDFYKVDDGTPSDCVFLSLVHFFKDKKPDLVVSGINIGANMGEDITYSGTVAAAMEATLQGIPAIAISQVCKNRCENIDELGYSLAKQTIKKVVSQILDHGFPLEQRKLLNINVPPIKPENCKGIKITKAGYRKYGLDAAFNKNPRGEGYYWIGLHPLEWESGQEKDCDFEAVDNDYVSITPVKLDLTAYEEQEKLQGFFI